MNRTVDNRQQLVEYITEHQADFYRLAYSYVKNRDAALDVVQESVAKALSNIGALRNPDRLRAWFTRILLNESMNYYRRNRGLVPYEDAPEGTAVHAPDWDARLDLYDAIDRLSPVEQTVIRLRFFQDLKLEEVAHATGANLNTVKSRLYTALKKLRALTGEELTHESSLE